MCQPRQNDFRIHRAKNIHFKPHYCKTCNTQIAGTLSESWCSTATEMQGLQRGAFYKSRECSTEKKLTSFPAHLFLLPETKQWNGSRLVNFKVEPGNKNSQFLELWKSRKLGVPLSPALFLPFHKHHHFSLVSIWWPFLMFKCALPTSLHAQNPSHTRPSLHSTAEMGLSTKAGLVRKKLFFHCELKFFLHYEFKLFHCELSPALTQLTVA